MKEFQTKKKCNKMYNEINKKSSRVIVNEKARKLTTEKN
jgi:hypothetical protein